MQTLDQESSIVLELRASKPFTMTPNSSRFTVQPLPSHVPRSLPDPKTKHGDEVENDVQPLLNACSSDDPVSKSDVDDFAVPVKGGSAWWNMKRVQGLGYIVFAGLNFSIASICIKYASHRVTSHETVFWRMIVALVLNYVS